MPIGIIYGSFDVSLSPNFCASTMDIHFQSEGILVSYPNVICQIWNAPGHSADTCPSHYSPCQQLVLPAYVTFNSVDVGEQLWYPDSAAASHMTSNDGKLHSKSLCSGSSLVKVGNGTLLPIKNIGQSYISTPIKPLRLNHVLHVP